MRRSSHLRVCFFILPTIAFGMMGCKTTTVRQGKLSKVTSNDSGGPRDDSAPQNDETNLVVVKSKFPRAITQSLVTRHEDELDRLQQTRSDRCAKTEALLERLITRLLAGNNLQDVSRQKPPLKVGVPCSIRTVKLPETKAGVIWIYPELLRAFNTEDQVAALLAHELVHYTRSHEEENEDTLSSWMPFREEAVNRSKWEQEKQADRLSVYVLHNAGFDPYVATEVPMILDKFLARETDWKEGQLLFPIGTMEDRSMRAQFEIKHKRFNRSPQTPGEIKNILEELASRP